jgi:putative ABC transport system substrate-binding protein
MLSLFESFIRNHSTPGKIIFSFCLGFLFLGISVPCPAQERTYRIEVVQVTDLKVFQMAYDGFLRELEKNGIIQGKNLTLKRTIVEFDLENTTLWKKLKFVVRIKNEASRIVKEKPDLVLTMGTPVTKYLKDKIIAAGIPIVFTASAFPLGAGCKSLTEAGPGFTGATSYMNMGDALRIVRLALPRAKTIGIVHSDEANSVVHVQEAVKEGPAHGFMVTAKQVEMKDSIMPAIEAVQKQGTEILAVPPDPYYEIRSFEAAGELSNFAKSNKIPVVSFVVERFHGCLLYVGPDLEIIGELSGQQAVKILKEGVRPESLPVLRQHDLTIMVDAKVMKALDIQLPPEILQKARVIE